MLSTRWMGASQHLKLLYYETIVMLPGVIVFVVTSRSPTANENSVSGFTKINALTLFFLFVDRLRLQLPYQRRFSVTVRGFVPMDDLE